jgi:PAS domain S-box-containing protein
MAFPHSETATGNPDTPESSSAFSLPLAEVLMKDRKPPSRRVTVPPRKKAPTRPTPTRRAKGNPPEDLSPFFDSPLDLLCIGDRNAIFQKLNPQWEASLGYPPNEMEGRDFIEFIHPDDRPAALEAFRKIARKKSVQSLTNRVRSRDGTYRWLEWKYVLRGERIFAAARDITDRKRVEDALRESRRMLETILDTIPVRVFWKDRRSVYQGCNRPFARDAGFSLPVEIIGRDDYQMGWVEQAGLYRTDDRTVMDTGREKIGYEEPQTQADGKHIWLRTSKVPLRDLEGNIRGVLGTYEDITEQKSAEKALRESEERYQRISRSITDYIYHVRVENGKIAEILHGRRCQAVTGYSPEELKADPGLWIGMVDPEDRPKVEEQARSVLSGRDDPVIDYRLLRKDGVRRWVRNTPVLHRDGQGNLISYDGLIRDITERKEAEIQFRAQYDLARALNATSSIKEGLRLCLNTAMRVSGMESGGIYLLDSNTGVLKLVVKQGTPAGLLASVAQLAPDRPEAQWIMEGRPIYTKSEGLASRINPVPRGYQGYSALIGLPIRHEDRIIGCLTLTSTTVETVPPPVRETLEATAAQIGTAIARLRTEEALRESEDRYRQLFEMESDAIFLIDNDSGEILEANSAASSLYGYTREEMCSLKNMDLSAEPEETRKTIRSASAAPGQVIIIPIRIHRKRDGSQFPVEITARFFSWRGRKVHIAAIRDITQRRKTEEDLRESRRMLELVLNTIPARVFWKDRNLVYLGCNRAFARDAGFQSPEELVGLDDYKIGWGDFVEEYQEADRNVIETGTEKLNYEEPVINSEGRHFWVSTSKIPLRDPDGNIRGVLGTYADFTERKKAEEKIRALNLELELRVAQRTAQLEAANKELEAFSYSVSHDLRAPLRAVDGFTRALAEDYGKTLDREGQRLCSVIRRNTQRMNELIDGLLALSRFSRTEMEFHPTDMESLARSAFQDLTTPEIRKRTDFRLEPLPDVTGDPVLLRQVWTNLLSNAIKFSANRDRSRIDVKCRRTPEEDVFSVRDNGAGFDMQRAERLFGAFQRLHDSADFEGTGVGLPIVQRVIHRHGGRVWAEGEVEKGAVFYFTIPRKKSEAEDLSALE